MLLALYFIELGIIWALCYINKELHNEKSFYEQKYTHLKHKIYNIIGRE